LLTRIAVDASVAIKWFLPEIHSEAALRLLSAERELLVPDLVWSEVGNILWKKWQQGQIADKDAPAILEDLGRLGLEVRAARELAASAWPLAARLRRTFYDSLYLALAELEACPLVTADRRLFNAVSPTGFNIVWVEEVL
jgi:predicted nucleic acid-binding protein